MHQFDQLHLDVCDVLGIEAGDLSPDPSGVQAFSIAMKDVTVNVMHVAASQPNIAFILVDFGPLPEGLEMQALRVLMLANFTMLGDESACSFSIHPLFDRVTLQVAHAFGSGDATRFLNSVARLCDLAVEWRETHFLDRDEQPAHGPRVSPHINPGV